MIWSAILIGIVGSLHCIGMCGPIALALPVPKDKNRYFGIALYNLGRIVTYGLLGLLFGSLGSLFVMAGLQQFLSIIAGLTLLLITILVITKNSDVMYFEGLNRILSPLKNSVRFYLKRYTFFSLFMIGILNGFLPCGLVYMSIIGAVATGEAWSGSLYMMLFGLGTAPAMFLVSVFGNTILFTKRYNVRAFLPYIIGMLSMVLILRGMNLGIPYLSPQISSVKLEASHCCSK